MEQDCNTSRSILNLKCFLLVSSSHGGSSRQLGRGSAREEVQADPGTLTLLFRCSIPMSISSDAAPGDAGMAPCPPTMS